MSLSVRDLSVAFGRRAPAVESVGFELADGERLGVIGESGSGKSVTSLALMGLLPEYARVTGSVSLDGQELLGLGDRELSKLRGEKMSMVFQEPMTALDPTMRVGRQIAEAYRLHHPRSGAAAREQVETVLDKVGFTDARRVSLSYPHELSGGQRQRVLLAMAVVNKPGLIIFDEPTTALDVLVQAEVLQLIDATLTATGASALFISHNIAVVSQVCTRAVVMRGGRIVEDGPIAELFEHPKHPYTRALVEAAAHE
ncbi:MAG: ABC transporter ATP-binding protein [Propionibacteriaceae bacterium]|jgi:ABC-type glutathione transport system ATPase component|nr:ABC transporter ATP-binding protein [Propionibacteriaceae bacterium]